MRTSARPSALASSAWNLSTTGFGVPAGLWYHVLLRRETSQFIMGQRLDILAARQPWLRVRGDVWVHEAVPDLDDFDFATFGFDTEIGEDLWNERPRRTSCQRLGFFHRRQINSTPLRQVSRVLTSNPSTLKPGGSPPISR